MPFDDPLVDTPSHYFYFESAEAAHVGYLIEDLFEEFWETVYEIPVLFYTELESNALLVVFKGGIHTSWFMFLFEHFYLDEILSTTAFCGVVSVSDQLDASKKHGTWEDAYRLEEANKRLRLFIVEAERYYTAIGPAGEEFQLHHDRTYTTEVTGKHVYSEPSLEGFTLAEELLLQNLVVGKKHPAVDRKTKTSWVVRAVNVFVVLFVVATVVWLIVMIAS